MQVGTAVCVRVRYAYMYMSMRVQEVDTSVHKCVTLTAPYTPVHPCMYVYEGQQCVREVSMSMYVCTYMRKYVST